MRLTEIDAIIDTLDVDDDALALGLTPAQVRDSIKEAVASGLLTIDSITASTVTLRGAVPSEIPEVTC